MNINKKSSVAILAFCLIGLALLGFVYPKIYTNIITFPLMHILNIIAFLSKGGFVLKFIGNFIFVGLVCLPLFRFISLYLNRGFKVTDLLLFAISFSIFVALYKGLNPYVSVATYDHLSILNNKLYSLSLLVYLTIFIYVLASNISKRKLEIEKIGTTIAYINLAILLLILGVELPNYAWSIRALVNDLGDITLTNGINTHILSSGSKILIFVLLTIGYIIKVIPALAVMKVMNHVRLYVTKEDRRSNRDLLRINTVSKKQLRLFALALIIFGLIISFISTPVLVGEIVNFNIVFVMVLTFTWAYSAFLIGKNRRGYTDYDEEFSKEDSFEDGFINEEETNEYN